MSIFLRQTQRRAGELQERRNEQDKCERCGLLYFKSEEKCPHCSELKDYQVKLLLKKRVSERGRIGKGMLIIAALVIILMILM